MKKYAPYIILFLFAALLFNSWGNDMTVNFDGDEIDGPLGWMLATLFAGGGTLLAIFITMMVGVLLAVIFAGVGVMLLGSLGIGAIVLALAISPLLLPLAIPVLLVWYLVSRPRKVSLEKPASA